MILLDAQYLPLVMSGLSGAAAFALVVGGGRMLLARRQSLAQRLHALDEQRRGLGIPVQDDAARQQGPLVAAINRVAGEMSFAQRLNDDLASADVRITVGEYIIFVGLLMAISILVGIWLRNVPLILIFLGGCFFAPRQWLKMRREKRIQKFDAQLFDAIAILANAMRSGNNLQKALVIAARETTPPMATELGRVVFDLSMHTSTQEALDTMLGNIQSDDLKLLINALNVQQENGGNIVVLLEEIGATIRQRVTLQAEVKSLTAQQRMSGYVVSLLPVGLIGLLLLVNPNYILNIFHTTLWCGWVMFGSAAIMIIAGTLIIRRVVDVRV